MAICNSCGREVNEQQSICPYCGELIVPAASVYGTTSSIAQPDTDEVETALGTGYLSPNSRLVLRVRGTDAVFTINPDERGEIVLGRHDPDLNLSPHIDLRDFGGMEKGVSRVHAVIVLRNGLFAELIDKGSQNGTYLNGQRLFAHQGRMLRNGDEIRLGRIVLYVQIEERAP
jgi:pSer/pThr/pTyr-binding forkhead associated (FHA) protein